LAAGVDADEHLRRIVRIHFDPEGGAVYWLERQRALGIDAVAEIRTIADLNRLGPMDERALGEHSVLDFVPRNQHGRLKGAVVTETGGTTGPAKRTVFSPDEFHDAFVEPFVRAAAWAGFPRGGLWLWLGPSGPHVIGRAASACAAALGSPQPFGVDFDPRWFRKLPADSLARERYLVHLLEQAMQVIEREPISVIFTTPAVLGRLAERMRASQRDRILGVHYGGMRVTPDVLRAAQTEWFPGAVHLAGYGNSLFGVCMEFGGPPDRPLRYHPFGTRLLVRVGDDGRVCMSRLDSTVLIANLVERDVALPCDCPSTAPAGFGPGVEDPRPSAVAAHDVDGIY
jgi:hypothetical protein